MDPRAWIVLGGIAAAASLQGRVGEGNAARRQNDFRYTPDPRVMEVVSLGHRSTLADLLWLRALPDMGRPFQDVELKKRWLAGATEAITELEPSFGTVYQYGAAYLSLIERNGAAAIELLEKGVRLNPDSAGLRVELALAYWQIRRDRGRTIEQLEAAAVLPGVDSLSLSMLAALRVRGREDLLALVHWGKLQEDGANSEIRVIAAVEFERTRVAIARRAADDFARRAGRPPATIDELRDPALIDAAALDVVLDGLTVDSAGRPESPRLPALEAANTERQANVFFERFREENGRWPSAEEFLSAWGALPAPPPGRSWEIGPTRVRLADAPE